MPDLIDLSKRLENLHGELVENTARGVAELTKAVGIELAKVTPVSSGRAQKNRVISENKNFPYDSTREPDARGNRRSDNYQLVKSKLEEAAKRLAMSLKNRKSAEVWVGNATPYLINLNDGVSNQAEAGFLDGRARRAFRKYSMELEAVIVGEKKTIDAR